MVARLATLSAALVALAQAAPPASGPVVHVNPNTKYQVYDGIGVSEAFQRSLVLHELNTQSQNLALDYLFSKTKGAVYCPTAPRSNSSQLNYIPLPRDDEYQVWLSHQAIARGVHTIYADAWSADGYMKTTGTDFNGGYLCGVTNTSCATGDWRQAYADKIVRYIQDYQAQGITVDIVGFLNEPDLNTTYASMQSDGQQAADFLKVLYPTLKAAGLSTQIACCDGSGWEQQRERLEGIQAAGEEYTLGLVTAHGYSSRPSTPFATSKKVWQTEWSSFDPINYNWYAAGNQSEGLTWANHIQQAFGVSNVTGFLYWWGAANTTDNQSLLFVNNTAEVRVTKRLWAHAHFGSRFIQQGAHRVSATVSNDPTSSLNVTAFANTDGSTAVQVINNGNDTETVTLQGLNIKRRNPVLTYLTNQANNLTQGYAVTQHGNQAVARVPAKSLLSFVVNC
ncbi:hypothetical protein H2203_004246 [Taxawa tesnikishii (nom. ined.)]|nr:hypothetical protein H2203_004246 [Dothideales sp. JES 119]